MTAGHIEEVAQTLNAKVVHPLLVPEYGGAEQGALWKVKPHEIMPENGLLSARFAHPLLPSSLVIREHLLARLDEALAYRLTLLSASAGWGKTTLLSTWAARSPLALAWLSLDKLDNAPTCFWTSVLAALRACLPGVGEMTLALLRSPQFSPLTAIVATLLHELGSVAQPIVLLLDDYHLIEEQAIHDSLLFLLEHLPAHLHLILASRTDPPLALARLRVRGQLLELRDADLCFHEEEARRFFSQALDYALLPEDVVHLTRRTEGWIAGLQLAALSLQQREDASAFVHSFTGSHRHVLDYVQEEILARLPAALHHFLPQIAILNKISAPLCQAVTGEAESWALLEQAERANLFLVPLDEERRWYRMHDLFRGALLARLRATQPELLPLLHQRAARFYEQRRAWREAISHLLEAEDFWAAALLMEQALEELWLSGESQVFALWVMALPMAVIRKHARFALTAALYTLNAMTVPAIAQARSQVEQILMRVEEAVLWDHATQEARAKPIPAGELALLKQRMFLLRLWGEAIAGGISGHVEVYRHTVLERQELELEDDMLWQMIPLSIRFLVCWIVQGEGTSLLPIYEKAWERARASRNRFALFKMQQWLSAIHLKAGKLRRLYQECQATLDLLAQMRGYTLLGGYLSLWQISVLYEWNRLDEARRLARELIYHARIGQQCDLQVQGYINLLKVELAAGEQASAGEVTKQLIDLVQETGWDRQWVPLMQVTCWLETGDLARAAQWATHGELSQETTAFAFRYKLLLLARISLALQQHQSALEILERYRKQLDQTEDIETLTSLLALTVVGFQQAGERDRVHTTLTRLLTLTEPEGYVRLYLDQGLHMQEALQDFLTLLSEARDQTSAGLYTYASRLLSAFAQEEQQRAVGAGEQAEILPAQQAGSDEEFPAPVLLEPLTSQEQRVLRLLVAGRSNQEIARLLVISLNTVKTHVKNLYSKLHVSSRAQARALAHALHLL